MRQTSFNIFNYVLLPTVSDHSDIGSKCMGKWNKNPIATIDTTNGNVAIHGNHLGAVGHIIGGVVNEIKKYYHILGERVRGLRKTVGPADDRIELLFLASMLYRRCTVYIVAQHSYRTGNVRITAYGTDYISHYGESFGTSLSFVKHEEILAHIESHVGEIEFSDKTATQKIRNSDYILFADAPVSDERID